MSLPTILSSFMVPQSILIHQFTTRRLATTRQEWRFRSGLELRWEPHGEEAGAGGAGGAETTTLRSTTTTTLIATRMSTVPRIGQRLADATHGSTIHNTAVARHTRTAQRQTDTAARLAAILFPPDKPMRGKPKRAGDFRPDPSTGEVGPQAVQIVSAQTAPRPAGIASAIEAYRRARDRGPKVAHLVELQAA